MLITSFGDEADRNYSRKPSTFEVAVNRVVSQTLAIDKLPEANEQVTEQEMSWIKGGAFLRLILVGIGKQSRLARFSA
jgi:hypothetical protein